jgi:hypothetical protein
MRHLQHLKNTNATCVQRFANINEKWLHLEDERLQHVKNTITTLIYNNCNIKKSQKNRRQVLRVQHALAMGGAAARCWRAPRPTPSPWDAASGGGLHPVGLGCGRRQRRGCPHPAASALPIVSSVRWRPARARARSPPPWPSGAPHGGSHPRMAGMTLPRATREWRSFAACSLEA